jgi:methionine-rich copper-binding protein CopC
MYGTVVALLTTLVTAMLVGVVTVATAAPASAHTALQSATPADGSRVAPPTRIVLTYNDPVRFTQVVVTDAAGRHYQSGGPLNVDKTVTENLSPPLPNGRYTVAWRVVAPDGHPVEGTYQFEVTGSSATAPAAAPAAPGQQTDTSSGSGLWWIVLIGLLVVAAAIGGVLLLRQSTSDADEDEEEQAEEEEAAAESRTGSASRSDTEAGTGQ